MNQLADDLRAAKALVDTPEKWLQGRYAADENGDPRCVNELDAVRFCALGAIYKAAVGAGSDYHLARDAFYDVAGEIVSEWNDAPARTHAEVMAAFDAAIAKAGSQP